MERGELNWLFSYSVPTNPDKMNMCESELKILLINKKPNSMKDSPNTLLLLLLLDLNHTSRELKFCLSGSRGFENCFPVKYNPEMLRQRWLHTCVVLSGLDPDTDFAKIKIFLEGKLESTAEFKTILDPLKDGEGLMILAQEQDSFGGGFDGRQSFAGMISQFNMFER